MRRKMVGVLTAVAAAMLLVGVAWASGDEIRDVSSSGSVAETSGSSASTPTSGAGSMPATTGVSAPGTSVGSSTTDVTVDDTTNTTVEDNNGTTGTTVDDNNGTTGTTVDDNNGTTGTTVDDHDDDDEDDDDEEVRAPAPVNSDAKSYLVGDAGSVTIQVVNGRLVLLDVRTNSGWTSEVDKARDEDVEIEFENGDVEASFGAKLRDGQIRIEIERD